MPRARETHSAAGCVDDRRPASRAFRTGSYRRIGGGLSTCRHFRRRYLGGFRSGLHGKRLGASGKRNLADGLVIGGTPCARRSGLLGLRLCNVGSGDCRLSSFSRLAGGNLRRCGILRRR